MDSVIEVFPVTKAPTEVTPPVGVEAKVGRTVSAVAFLSCRLYGRKKFSQQPMLDR